MLDDILQLLHQNISHRIWFISDLQQSISRTGYCHSPDNVKTHFVWSRPYRRQGGGQGLLLSQNSPYVDDHNIPQIDVASLRTFAATPCVPFS